MCTDSEKKLNQVGIEREGNGACGNCIGLELCEKLNGSQTRYNAKNFTYLIFFFFLNLLLQLNSYQNVNIIFRIKVHAFVSNKTLYFVIK